MQCTQKPPAYRRRFYTSPRVLCILGFVCAYLISLATFVPQASAATLSGPGGNVADPVVRQVDIARPAVVRIITTINGQLTVHFTSTVTTTFPTTGGSYPILLSGTGAFVSAHGDILTADHVVNPPHDASLDGALYYYAAQDVADYINAHFQVTAPYSASDAYSLLVAGSLPSTTAYAQPSSEVYLSTSYAGQIDGNKLETLPVNDHATVDQIVAQSSFNANDVAIIHVGGMDNMPSIQLGDSSQVAEQDNLTIIGYPGLGDLSSSSTDLLTSSINKVYVSALKTTDAGAQVIQVGGNVEHGDSGGPALDSNGNIVGIVSFDYSGTNGDYGETSFLQASNSALTLIKAQNINTTPGTFESAWTQAVNDYASSAAGHWHKAAQELQNLATAYPNFVGVSSYLTYAQTEAIHEQPVSSGLDLNILWIVLLLVALILLGVLFFIILRRNARPAVAMPGAAQYPAGAYSMYPQQSGVYPPPFGVYSPQSGTYVPAPANNGTTGVLTPGQVLPNSQPGMQQPLQSGAAYPNYTSPMAYGAQPAQIPQTPPVTPGAFQQSQPWQMPEQNAAFSLAPVQTPQPIEHEIPAHPLPTWGLETPIASPTPVIPFIQDAQAESAAPLEASAQPTFEPVALPEADTMPEPDVQQALTAVQDKSATYILPADQAEVLNPRTLAMPPAATPSSSDVDETATATSAARSFSVPRRPSSSETVLPETPEGNTPGAYTWTAPCGHTNPPGVRFCRVCGQRVADSGDSTL